MANIVINNTLLGDKTFQNKDEYSKEAFKNKLREEKIEFSNAKVNHIFNNDTKAKYPTFFVQRTGRRNSNILNVYGFNYFLMKMKEASISDVVVQYRKLKTQLDKDMLQAYRLRSEVENIDDDTYKLYEQKVDDVVTDEKKLHKVATKLRKMLTTNSTAIKSSKVYLSTVEQPCGE